MKLYGWSHQSKHMTNWAKNVWINKSSWDFLFMRLSELHGDKNESRKETVNKTNLKVEKTNSFQLRSLYKFSYTPRGGNWDLSLSGVCRTTPKPKTNIFTTQTKNPLNFARTVSTQKHKLSNKNNLHIQIRLISTVWIFSTMISFNCTCQ